MARMTYTEFRNIAPVLDKDARRALVQAHLNELNPKYDPTKYLKWDYEHDIHVEVGKSLLKWSTTIASRASAVSMVEYYTQW